MRKCCEPNQKKKIKGEKFATSVDNSEKQIPKVKVRKPEQFVAILKASLLNLFRFILFESKTNKADPPAENQMVINRKGNIEINNWENTLEEPWRQNDRTMLRKIVDYINGLQMKTLEGKKILVRLRSG